MQRLPGAKRPGGSPYATRAHISHEMTWNEDHRRTLRSMKSTSSRDTLVSGVPTDNSCDE
jgi:hypothetical protein